MFRKMGKVARLGRRHVRDRLGGSLPRSARPPAARRRGIKGRRKAGRAGPPSEGASSTPKTPSATDLTEQATPCATGLPALVNPVQGHGARAESLRKTSLGQGAALEPASGQSRGRRRGDHPRNSPRRCRQGQGDLARERYLRRNPRRRSNPRHFAQQRDDNPGGDRRAQDDHRTRSNARTQDNRGTEMIAASFQRLFSL